MGSRVVGIATGYGLDYPVLISTTMPIRCGPTQLPLSGYRVSFPWAKRPWCKVDHSSPSNAEVENEWSYTSSPPICLCGVGRDYLNFYNFPLFR